MPNKTDIKRKVAAIMFTDIAGYTKLTSEDEEKAFQLIKRKRELLLPLLEKYSGKLIKEIGDGTLTRYFNTKDAIDCANNFQARTDNELKVRAGIHSGEVIIENGGKIIGHWPSEEYDFDESKGLISDDYFYGLAKFQE